MKRKNYNRFKIVNNREKHRIIGEIVTLLLQSSYRMHPISDLLYYFFPPLYLNQFRLYKRNNTLVGFISWAYFSLQKEREYQQGQFTISTSDWRSGDRLWFVDFIAPFGDAKDMIRDIRQFMTEKEAYSLKTNQYGEIIKIYHWRK